MHYLHSKKKYPVKTVIHVCQFLKHGSGKGTIQLIKTLKSLGFEQKLILPQPVKEFDDGLEELSEIWKLGVSSQLVDSTFVRESWTAQSLRKCIGRLITSSEFAIVTHGGFSADVVRAAGLRFTHYCHGFGLGRPYWVNEQDKRGISAAYRVLVASENIALQCRLLGIPKELIYVHYYPLKLSIKEVCRPKFDTKINLGQVGNFVPLKGHEYSLKVLSSILSFSTFNKSQIFLHFFGMGPLQVQIEKKVDEMGLRDNVLFHGHCSKSKIYSSIDIMLLPSLVEGLGMVNVEATEFGIPVCAFDVGGVGEIIQHGESGLLSTVRDSSSMAKNVIKLVENPALVTKLVQGAQRKIKNMFDLPEKGALLKSSIISAKV